MSELNTVVQYTSKSFEAILTDINNNDEFVDKPNWWKRGIAGIGDVIAMWNNALANNLLLKTAYTRKNVKLLLELIDYELTPHSTSDGILIFYIKSSVIFPFTIDETNLVGMTSGSLSVSSKRFEARSSVTVSEVSEVASSVDYTEDTITVSREYLTGEKIRLSTSDTLPDPLEIDTDYYVIAVDETTIKLATSLINSYSSVSIDLTDSGVGDHTINLYSIQVQCYQQQSVDSYSVGTSDGTSDFQEFELSDDYVLEDTVSVTVNSQEYELVDSYVDSEETDYVFRLFYNTDMSAFIQFGGNDFGAVPSAFDVNVSYAYGGGAESNVSVVNSISIYGGTDTNIEGVSNSESFTGGADEEAIGTAKVLGPLLLKARDRFITTEDGEALSLDFGGISIAKIIKNAYGILSAKSVNIATGGGQISTQSKSNLKTYLTERTLLEEMYIQVEDAIITDIDVTASAKVKSGYDWDSQIAGYFRVGWKLFFSNTGYELQQDYISNGIESTVSLINLYFSESFGEDDYTQIAELITNLDTRDFNDSIRESDVYGYLDSSIFGLDYFTITLPAFPISLDEDEITDYGSLDLTEVE